MLVCALLSILHARPRVQRAPGFPCALFSPRAERVGKTRATCAARSRSCGCRHCEERERRSNPFSLFAVRWIASRSLSSGARSRDPVARNDGMERYPTGKSAKAVQPHPEKYSAFAVGQISATSSPVSRPQEGRIAIVTDVGRRMRWTRRRQARSMIVRTNGVFADGEVVWS